MADERITSAIPPAASPVLPARPAGTFPDGQAGAASADAFAGADTSLRRPEGLPREASAGADRPQTGTAIALAPHPSVEGFAENYLNAAGPLPAEAGRSNNVASLFSNGVTGVT